MYVYYDLRNECLSWFVECMFIMICGMYVYLLFVEGLFNMICVMYV